MLWVGSVGQTGLYAVGDVLSGAVNPSGSLPDTWWKDNQLDPVQNNFGVYTYEGQEKYTYPANANSYNHYVVYQEGVYLGYKYTETRYEDVVLGTPNAGNFQYNNVVAYPFGYGLSYTNFAFSDMQVQKVGEGLNTGYQLTVTVTNTGDKAGKKAVQVYAQKPYTDYDVQNHIEKPAVEFVGFSKTKLLQPGESETVTVSVPEYFLTSYDAYNTGVYILEEGAHYLTIADDAHAAANNILTVKGKTTADGMTADGDASMVYTATYSFDATTYAKAYGTGNDVTSLFAAADVNRYEGSGDNTVTYYSRSNWEGTVTPGAVKLAMTQQLFDDTVLTDSDLPSADGYEWPVFGKQADLQLINMRGVDADDPQWETFMDQLTFDQLAKICANGLRMTIAINEIGKPETVDHNGPSGVTQKYSVGSNGYAVQTNDPDKNMKGTCYPCNGIIAATMNSQLVEEVGELIGEDAMWAGYAGLYGTGLNIHRSPYSGRVFEYYSEDGTLTVLGARQTAPHRIEIPTEICGRRVAAIAPKAFFASGTLEQLVVGGGVREIGESAFFGCRQLVSVSFERGLEQLKDSAFAGCESLTQVTLPWGTSAVGRMAFFGCTRLSFVKMPTTTRVSDFAFDGCAPGIRVFGGVYAGRMNPISE